MDSIKAKAEMGLPVGLDDSVTCGSGMMFVGFAVGAMLGTANAWDATEMTTKICQGRG